MIVTLAKAALVCSLICLISATDYPCHKPTTTTTPPPPTCGPNQKYTDCDNHPCRDTCDKPNLSKVCKYAPGKYPGCICVDGYVKDNDGSCIRREICDITCSDPNAELQDFPNICPDGGTCFNPEPGLCRIAFPRKGCHCKKGYVKDENGKCILLSNCPPKCEENETPISGGLVVKEKTCEIGLLLDATKCRCKDGFVRHSGKCIKACDCLKCTKPFEVFKYCGTACPATCKNQEGKKPCGEICSLNCVSGCFCKEGFVRDDVGNCIDPEKCPPKCGENEIPISGGNIVKEKTCHEGELVDATRCRCKDGLVRHLGKCIKRCDCPPCPYSKRGCLKTTKPCCGANAEYIDKAPVYPETCTSNPHCTSCKPGCACKTGYIRESSAEGAKCILPCQCPCRRHY